jgi:acyl dehydratase
MATTHTYYDDLHEGQTFPSYTWTVTAEDAKELSSCVKVGPLRRPDGSEVEAQAGAGPEPVSPFLLNTFKAMRASFSMPDGLLHARETMTFSEPVHPGDELTLKLSVESKYIKNDKKFVLLRHAISRGGTPVMSVDRLIVWVR